MMRKRNGEIKVFPNPIIKDIIRLKLNNLPAGEYGIKLLNKSGQVIMTKHIQHAGGSGTENLQLDYYTLQGIYELEINKPDGNRVNIRVVI